jgi:hypothetical protein
MKHAFYAQNTFHYVLLFSGQLNESEEKRQDCYTMRKGKGKGKAVPVLK